MTTLDFELTAGHEYIQLNNLLKTLQLAQTGGHAKILIQNGEVLVNGEVMVPQAVVLDTRDNLDGYIKRVGGYTDRADEDRSLIIRQNGEVVEAQQALIRPGDEIVVLPKVPVKNLQLAATVSQIVFQIALAAATVAGL